MQALNDCAGRDHTPVEVLTVGPQRVRLRWTDGGVPQMREYETPLAAVPPMPTTPDGWIDPGLGLLRALGDAAACTARHSVRFALGHLQLRGQAGQIVASDGRQLLVQRGFRFPFTEDLLVPALTVFGGKELPANAPVRLGLAGTFLAMRIGPWTFFLPLDRKSRYPNVDEVIPKRRKQETAVRVTPEDAALLLRALPRLPSDPDSHDRVTVDLNGHVAVRASSDPREPPTEVVLERSTTSGPPVRFATDRAYLARALKLGFTEFRVTSADAPVLCRDEKRLFLWLTLGKDDAVPPGEAVPVRADAREPSTAAERELRKPMTPPTNDGSPPQPASSPRNGHPPTDEADALLAKAEALRMLLNEAAGRANRLTLALKQQRRQAKALRAALASLRSLDARV